MFAPKILSHNIIGALPCVSVARERERIGAGVLVVFLFFLISIFSFGINYEREREKETVRHWNTQAIRSTCCVCVCAHRHQSVISIFDKYHVFKLQLKARKERVCLRRSLCCVCACFACMCQAARPKRCHAKRNVVFVCAFNILRLINEIEFNGKQKQRQRHTNIVHQPNNNNRIK